MAKEASNAARAGGAALVLACVFSLLAINERASRSPAAVLVQQGPVNVWQQIGAPEPGLAAQQLMKQNDNFGYKANVQMLADIRGSGEKRRAARTANVVALPSAGEFGTDRAFLNKHDGKGMGHVSRLSGFGTDQAFLHMGDGAGQSTKGKTQQLYEWKADMEGTYLEPNQYYSGAGTKQAQMGQGWVTDGLTYANNLGGIPGEQPANVLPLMSHYVMGRPFAGQFAGP